MLSGLRQVHPALTLTASLRHAFSCTSFSHHEERVERGCHFLLFDTGIYAVYSCFQINQLTRCGPNFSLDLRLPTPGRQKTYVEPAVAELGETVKLTREADRIRGNRRRCNARGVTRMVLMGRCVPLLSGQSIPKGRKLEHQDTGRHCVHLVYSTAVSDPDLRKSLSGELTKSAPSFCPS